MFLQWKGTFENENIESIIYMDMVFLSALIDMGFFFAVCSEEWSKVF